MDYEFERDVLVRFHHCDPAGVAFYPEYLVLFNELFEDWFNYGLKINFAEFHTKERLGFPVVRIECDFCSPTSVGETLHLRLSVMRIGTTAMTLKMEARGREDELRVRAIFVVVLTSLDEWKPLPITGELLRKIQPCLAEANP